MKRLGGYTLAETVPTGYQADGGASKTVSVTTVASCGDGNEDEAAFGNTPLTDVTISVNSLVDGGTSTFIAC